MIECKSLCFSYKSKDFIKGLSATFANGEITAILGENGSGKSTLLNLITGNLNFAEGEILVDGCNIGSIKKSELSKKLSYFPQGREMLDLTAYEMIMLGRFPYTRGRLSPAKSDEYAVEQAMHETETERFRDISLRQLSYGERQKVYFAMQMAQGARNILLDEPLNFMDAAAKFDMARLLLGQKRGGKCVVAVLHDIALALKISDKIILMKNGRIISDASVRKTLESGAIREALGVDIITVENGEETVYAISDGSKCK